MATNKTPNLQMDSWAAADYFKRAELNGNFDKIDAKVGEVDGRLGEHAAQLADTTKAIGVNLSKFPRVDGETDDTGRFKRAIASIDAPAFQATDGATNGSYTSYSVQFNIPAGRYTISDEIVFLKSDGVTNLAYVNIVCDSKAIIEQTTIGKRIFVFNNAYLIDVRGIKFLKGSNAIYLQNNNTDASLFNFELCEFQLQEDYSIHTWSPIGDNHMSANLTIRKCRFIKSRKVLHNVCDNAIVDDCWVRVDKSNFEANTAAFKNLTGWLRFNKMFGVPTMGVEGTNRLANVRWVDNYENFIANESRFGGEEAGMPIVYQFGDRTAETTYPFQGHSVIIENSECTSGHENGADSGIINLMTSIPQYVRIQGNKYIFRPIFVNTGGLDLNTYFDGITSPEKKFQFIVTPNMTVGDVSVLDQLKAFVHGKLTKPFPIETQNAVATATANQYKKTFNIPFGIKSFMGILTISSQQSSNSTNYRATSSYFITMGTGFLTGIGTGNFLESGVAFAPLIGDSSTSQNPPSIISLHFGDGDTGSKSRTHADGGKFTVVFDKVYGSANVTFSLLHTA